MKLFITCMFSLTLSTGNTFAQNWVKLDQGLGISASPYYFLDEERNELYVKGHIRMTTQGDTLNGVARWDGNHFIPLGKGGPLNPVVYGMSRFKDTLFLSTFIYFKPLPADIYKFWSRYDSVNNKLDTLNFGPVNDVTFTMKEHNGLLYASGVFTKCGNDSTWGFCTYDGIEWKSIFSYARPIGDDYNFSKFTWYKNKLYVGGNFYLVDAYGAWIEDVAILDNGLLYPFGGPIDFTFEGFVNCFAVFHDELYIAGYFLSANGIPVNHIVRWDGNQFKEVTGGLDYWVSDMIVYNNNLYVSGAFNYTGDGKYAPNIARWDGEEWHSFTSNIFDGSPILDMEIYNDELYISGGFVTIDGDTFNHVAKYNHQLPGDENELEVFINNPGEEIIVEYEDTNAYTIDLAVYTAAGQQVIAHIFPYQSGYTHQAIPIPGLAPGVYIVTAVAGDKKVSKKLLKI